ncbi:CDP-glycerol glycerophosphotransferase family protein [Paenibacillus sp. B01]|uniref:CDP-glycerol glycerophosphotransferase family protein n=1 Tax=Paenibacillus sp. B01 TaxID=2660554 RepID=UPI00129BC677|nr:CDP-glycerol glycerophosphotransferase family protein [Paenibacillus sp. B01]QGG58083.1 hypothetical protein GE073_22580 [Paenibacillus sp. B01]
MRLNQKKRILNLITSMDDGLRYSRTSEIELAAGMLDNCLYCLNFLLDLLKEEPRIVLKLQQAQRTVETMLEFANIGRIDGQRITETEQIMRLVRDHVVHDLKTEIEIAFFPYKSSMWDCMDSIYRTAAQDPDCVCYVVPIPYFEKNSEGQIVRYFYEGNQFPGDVPVVPFDLYNFEDRCPDIIYFHNPYDEYNTLTSVHPRFYSNKLAEATEMLVYVPYYVAGSSEKLDLIKLPAYDRSHHIIAQSEINKQSYVHAGIPDEKVLVLGSPKIDAALKAARTERYLPKAWRTLKEARLVFLLNTGIADLLAANDWIGQLEKSLHYFIENSEFGLIWRPHPLTDTTITTMRPGIRERFDRLVRQAHECDNIQIDQGSDAYPAIIASDALISDYSSILLQYITTGKPVLGLLSSNMLDESRHYHSDYRSCYFECEGISLRDFIHIVETKDEKKEKRMSAFHQSLAHADGTAGETIHRHLKNVINLTKSR